MLYHTKKKIKMNSANLMTLFNLSLGGFSAIAVINDQFTLSMLFIFIAAFCDRWDGIIARKFQIESELGKQLDSLCDLVSFGIAPALLVYGTSLHELGAAGMFFTVFFIGCGAFRLARFNVQTVKGIFVGVPIPVAGCLAAFSNLFADSVSPILIMLMMCFLSLAMVSTIKMKKI